MLLSQRLVLDANVIVSIASVPTDTDCQHSDIFSIDRISAYTNTDRSNPSQLQSSLPHPKS
jgi:hypothetical protein